MSSLYEPLRKHSSDEMVKVSTDRLCLKEFPGNFLRNVSVLIDAPVNVLDFERKGLQLKSNGSERRRANRHSMHR